MLFLDYNFELANEGDEIWDDLEDGGIINLSNIRSKRACAPDTTSCSGGYCV